jgi:hypothetical protein
VTDFKCSHAVHSDAAKRMADIVTQKWTDEGYEGTAGKWMAFSLADGNSNGDAYPRKIDAVKHNDEFTHAFIVLHPGGMDPCEAEVMLRFHRSAYDAGFRLADPDLASKNRSLIPRIGRENIAAQIQGLLKGSR